MNTCFRCGKSLTKDQKKYCSNLCQSLIRYEQYIAQWKTGDRNGGRGIVTKNISGHIRRFLEEKCGEACVICGWNQKNGVTNKVPLEIDHVDGNSENNREENLRLICPNCHSLSANYRNLNYGHGRVWRKNKYRKNEV